MRKKIYLTGFFLCVLLSAVSLFQVISHYADACRREEEFACLAGIVEQAGEETPEGEILEGENQSPLNKYRELFSRNNEMAGWICIEGTKINYPVMHTPENPDFYLKHSFDREYSAYGVPYVAGHCSPSLPSDNVLIYGHHMKNGTMFTELEGYEDKDFYEKHKVIHFDTLTRAGDYEVMAVFKTTVYDGRGFRFYLFANAKTEEDFRTYVSECKSLALYETGVTAEYGDKLVTLSTCEYSHKDGRLVVVAKKIGRR